MSRTPEFKVGDIVIESHPREDPGVCLVIEDQYHGIKFLWLQYQRISMHPPEMFKDDIVLGNISENLVEFVEALQKLQKGGGSGT